MFFKLDARVLVLHILLTLAQFVCSQQTLYKVPNVRIQAFKPKGFRASIEGKYILIYENWYFKMNNFT